MSPAAASLHPQSLRRTLRSKPLALLGTLALSVVPACSPGDDATVLTGTLTAVGGPDSGFSEPTAGQVTIANDTIRVPGSGQFEVELAPGRYEIAASFSGGECDGPPAVRLEEGRRQRIRFTCVMR